MIPVDPLGLVVGILVPILTAVVLFMAWWMSRK